MTPPSAPAAPPIPGDPPFPPRHAAAQPPDSPPPPPPPPPAQQTTAAAHAQASRNRWGIFASILVLTVILYWLRFVLLPFVGAAALAFLGTPVVEWLTRRYRLRRRTAGIVVFAGICLLAVGLGWWVKAVVLPQSLEMGRDLPHLVREMVTRVIDGREIHLMGRTYDTGAVTLAIDDATNRFTAAVPLMDLVGYAAAGGMGIFLVFVLLFYFLVSGPTIVEGMVRMLPPRHRPGAWELARKIRPMLFHYFCGLIVIVAYTTVVTWLGTALILHDPHAAVTAITVGFLELLPVVGPTLSGILLAATAFERGQHLELAMGFLVFALLLRLSIDQVVGPLVLGRAVTLHPVVIIFAFLAGGVLFGAVGVLLAIPAAATIKILLESAYGDSGRRTAPAS